MLEKLFFAKNNEKPGEKPSKKVTIRNSIISSYSDNGVDILMVVNPIKRINMTSIIKYISVTFINENQVNLENIFILLNAKIEYSPINILIERPNKNVKATIIPKIDLFSINTLIIIKLSLKKNFYDYYL